MKEPKVGNYTPPKPFGLYGDGLAIHEILRLLLGSVNVFDKNNDRLLVIRENELRRGGRRLANPEKIVPLIFGPDVSVSDYETFAKKANAANAEFFRTLQRELTLALVAKKDKRYTESFLYLYRVLEYISLALPMIYSLTKTDFRSSHEFIKSLMANDRDGDLKALQAAMPSLSAAGGLTALNFDFSIAGLEVAYIGKLKQQLDKTKISELKGFEYEEQGDILFHVSFNSMPAFFASVRNRMFHYRIGESNIDLGDIGGAEQICGILVGEIVHWFTLTYTEVVRVLARQHI